MNKTGKDVRGLMKLIDSCLDSCRTCDWCDQNGKYCIGAGVPKEFFCLMIPLNDRNGYRNDV